MNYCRFRNDFIKRMANAGGGGLLPREYQQVEYIETANVGSSILSGLNSVTSNTSFDIEFNMFNASSNNSIFTSRAGGGGTGIYFGTWGGGCYQFGTSVGYTTIPIGVKVRYKTDRGIMYRYDYSSTQWIQVVNVTYSSFTFNGAAPLFCELTGTTYTNYSTGRLYHFAGWDGVTLISDLYPCYRKSDNVTGLYNLVTNTFITARSGSFIVGNNV